MTHQKKGRNNKNRTITDKRFPVGFVFFFLTLTVLMISGGGLTVSSRVNAATTRLPTCTDPTGQNLPCMMVISTLPPPPNPIQCQETTGQILPCSYATQILSNGQQIVVIIVYVQPNFIFVGGPISVVKVIHEHSKSKGGGGGGPSPYALSITIKVGKDPIVRGNIETITVTVSDKSNPSKKIVGAKVSGELFYPSGFHKSISCSNTNQNGDSKCSFIIGSDSKPGNFRITIDVSASGYKPTSKSATFTVIPANVTFPTNATNTNATNTNATNTNATINTSTNLTSTSNMSSIVSKPPNNTSAAIQPGNTSNPTSGEGKGKGTTCTAGNCTSGPQTTKMCPDGSLIDVSANCLTNAPPPLSPALTPGLTTAIDCKANPNDPSCTKTLAPPPTAPTTHSCPDGSQPDSTGKCPSQSTQNPNNSLEQTTKTKTKTCLMVV
jgi:hypothetical protein